MEISYTKFRLKSIFCLRVLYYYISLRSTCYWVTCAREGKTYSISLSKLNAGACQLLCSTMNNRCCAQFQPSVCALCTLAQQTPWVPLSHPINQLLLDIRLYRLFKNSNNSPEMFLLKSKHMFASIQYLPLTTKIVLLLPVLDPQTIILEDLLIKWFWILVIIMTGF